jgi:hypothetical protein
VPCAVSGYVDKLIRAALRAGLSRKRAIDWCRALATVTINHAIVEAQAVLDPDHTADTQAEVTAMERNLPATVRWILAGAGAEAATPGADPQRRRRRA